MQFIKLPKLTDIAMIELSELVVDWINSQSLQNINLSCVQNLHVSMLISLVIE
jgi:hypothetical protein